MLSFTRTKRVTDSFDEEARARLVGADHRQLSSGDGDSLSLSYLVHTFLEQDTDGSEDSTIDDSDWNRVDSENNSPSDSPSSGLSLSSNADPYRNSLIAHVSEATEKFAFLREQNASLFRRHVAEFLREKRHDAAVCESSTAAAAGSYEFIDVVQPESVKWRYFVDLDFRSQFEIARPTRWFSVVLDAVPGVFVGGEEELRRTVSTVCDAARRCFRSRGLPIPPWRKNRFMQSKWFGPYRRIANPVQRGANGVSCMTLEFDDVVLDVCHRRSVRTR